MYEKINAKLKAAALARQKNKPQNNAAAPQTQVLPQTPPENDETDAPDNIVVLLDGSSISEREAEALKLKTETQGNVRSFSGPGSATLKSQFDKASGVHTFTKRDLSAETSPQTLKLRLSLPKTAQEAQANTEEAKTDSADIGSTTARP